MSTPSSTAPAAPGRAAVPAPAADRPGAPPGSPPAVGDSRARPQARPGGDRPARRALAVRYAAALGVYAAVKAAGFAVFLALLAYADEYGTKAVGRGGGARPWDVLGSWDGVWYQRIALNGYHPQLIPLHGYPHATLYENSAVFFPLYPWLIRIVCACTGLGTYGAGMLVAVVASFVAAAGIFAVTARLGGARAGVVAAAVWGLFPGSGVEWAVYSDSLFVALAAWSCYCVMSGRWLTAGLLALTAGLGRPTAAALIAAVSITALVALVRRTDGIARPLTAMLITPWGLLGYLGWVGWKLGDPAGYFHLQRGAWNRYFDFGAATAHSLLDVLVGRWYAWQVNPVPDLIAIALLIALPGLVVLLLRIRPPLVLVLYTGLTIVAALASNQIFDNISRYLLPAFPLFAGLAVALRRHSWSTLAGLLALPALASGWYAGYALFELGVP
ncbi:hypothetical protein [Kitasatospora sp. NPDC057015]|uniref:hypothetical protein n=1 Tax=Kitasatospora sp. NPDC057015 TaxID=3346001 RepID=UPI0036386877